jgi:pimeloyl-ACP methyl ester carboxylesterase
LAYPPDFLPGGQEITTPYGKTRVFEFGPEKSSTKVLLIHGISTPCISVAGLARQLAKKGCRVMLFDLYGRGFSDNPTHYAHTAELYISQILAVLASSPISWTGDNAFALIGYSLGGGIAAAFADCFPNLIKSLVLICPAGIVRDKNIARQRNLMNIVDGLIPPWILQALLRRRLDNLQRSLEKHEADKRMITGNVTGEVAVDQTDDVGSNSVIKAVEWQVGHHAGFLNAFISCVKHAPISGQQAAWRRIGQRLKTQNLNPDQKGIPKDGFAGGKLILIFGKTDEIILSKEVEADANAIVGRENIHAVTLDAGHELPIIMPELVAKELWVLWTDYGVLDAAKST